MKTPKLNRQQKLLTAEQARKLPPLYAQDGKGMKATAYVKFFGGAFTWYATEYDPAEGMFFGLIHNASMGDQCPHGEFGYFSAEELCRTRLNVTVGGLGRISLPLERDIHFKPKSLAEAVAELTGCTVAEVLGDDAEPAVEVDPAQLAAEAEFDACDPAAHDAAPAAAGPLPGTPGNPRSFVDGLAAIFKK